MRLQLISLLADTQALISFTANSLTRLIGVATFSFSQNLGTVLQTSVGDDPLTFGPRTKLPLRRVRSTGVSSYLSFSNLHNCCIRLLIFTYRANCSDTFLRFRPSTLLEDNVGPRKTVAIWDLPWNFKISHCFVLLDLHFLISEFLITTGWITWFSVVVWLRAVCSQDFLGTLNVGIATTSSTTIK